MSIVLVAIGAALGAPVRYLLDRAIQSRHERIFPWGTFVINVSGAFVLGFMIGISDGRGINSHVLLASTTGFLGGYTTFSTYTWETARLLEDGAYAEGLANLIGSVAAGLCAAAVGLYAGGLI